MGRGQGAGKGGGTAGRTARAASEDKTRKTQMTAKITKMSEKASTRGVSGKPTPEGIIAAFRKLDKAGENQVLISDLRKHFKGTREEFDRAIHGMRGKSISLQPDEGRFGRISDAERAGGITDPNAGRDREGTTYVYVALREP